MVPVLAFTRSAGDPATLDRLRAHVREHAERRPGVYEFLDESGAVFYVGKAKSVRARLLSYFTAPWPDAKGARLIRAAAAIRWRYVPSEFAAHLGELRAIARWRPPFNWQLNRARRTVFIKMSGGPAPRLSTGGATGREDARWYGPFPGPGRVRDGVRTLHDLLRLVEQSHGHVVVVRVRVEEQRRAEFVRVLRR